MGALPIVLLILAMKIPIFGVMALVWWAARGYDRADPEKELRKAPPRRPRPDRPGTGRRPRRRGPHGGAAAALPIGSPGCRPTCVSATTTRSPSKRPTRTSSD